MMYKVGDRVRIREWDDMVEEYGLDNEGDIRVPTAFVEDMRIYCGQVVTLSEVVDNYTYEIIEDGGQWWYSREMFEDYLFKVGDIVTGLKGSDDEYLYTNSDSICEVTNIDYVTGEMIVKIIDQLEYPSKIGELYPVEPEFFKLVETSVVNSTERFEIHKEICDELHETYVRKNTDYGNSFGETFEELGLISAVSRMMDKINRLKTIANGHDPLVEDESLEDTLLDLANYSIITLVEIQASKVKNESKQLIKKGDLVEFKPIGQIIDMLDDDYEYKGIPVTIDMLRMNDKMVMVDEIDDSDSTFLASDGNWYHFDMVDFVE